MFYDFQIQLNPSNIHPPNKYRNILPFPAPSKCQSVTLKSEPLPWNSKEDSGVVNFQPFETLFSGEK